MHRARTVGCAPNADLVRVGVLPEVIRDGPVDIGVLPIDYRAMRSAGRCPHHLYWGRSAFVNPWYGPGGLRSPGPRGHHGLKNLPRGRRHVDCVRAGSTVDRSSSGVGCGARRSETAGIDDGCLVPTERTADELLHRRGGAVAPSTHRRHEDGARYGHRIGWRSSGERSAGCSSFLSARWQNAAFAALVNLGRNATPGHELLKYGAWGAWPGSLWREGLASSGAAEAGSHTWICLPVSADRPEDHALFWGQ